MLKYYFLPSFDKNKILRWLLRE